MDLAELAKLRYLEGRTATYAAVLFMQSNGWDLQFTDNSEDELSELTKIILAATASEITKDK